MTTQQTKLSEDWIGSPGTITGSEAADIYKRAILLFGSSLTQDKRKIVLAQQTASLQDLEHIVETARKDYESSRHQKSRKWLERFSSRLMHYGNVFDVLAQHHPEYVSLAWGAIKFLLVACLNHEYAVTSIAKALARIADALPRVGLMSTLYPTTRMTAVIEELYAYIVRFLIRAYNWYHEGAFRHILHSITRPVELRYQDLLEHIETCSRTIEQLAISGSQVELRQVHTLLKTISDRVDNYEGSMSELKHMIMNYQSINATSLVDTNQKVSDLQFSEMVRIATEPSSFDPLESYNQAVGMRNLRQRSQRNQIASTFWQTPALRTFASSQDSCLILVKGTFKERWALCDTAVRVTEELKRKNLPALWAVNTRCAKTPPKTPSWTDILKSLVAQAFTLNDSAHSQKSTALSCAQLHTATAEKQWFDILGAAIAELRRETYIIIELDVPTSSAEDTFSNGELIELFCKLFEELTARGVKPAVKVFVLTCTPCVPLQGRTGKVISTAMPRISSPRANNQAKRRTMQLRTPSHTTTLRSVLR